MLSSLTWRSGSPVMIQIKVDSANITSLTFSLQTIYFFPKCDFLFTSSCCQLHLAF